MKLIQKKKRKSGSKKQSNLKKLKSLPARLNTEHCDIVRRAKKIHQHIYAIAVCSNHVHIVVKHTDKSIEKVVSFYKNAARLALRSNGFNGRIWTRGFYKRFCFNQEQLLSKINYVEKHAKNG